jgi:type II secretory pathway component PulM
MTLNERMQALRDKWERLSQRERTMVTALGVTFVIMLTLIVGFLITDGLASMEQRNADMRQALRDLDTQRDSYLRMKAQSSQLATRLGQTPVQLAGYVEQAAKEAGIEISEQSELPPTAAGKRFVEHGVSLRLRAVTLEQLVKFMRTIETGRSLVIVTDLQVRARDDKHEQFDVEMSVATFERDNGKNSPKKDKK